MILGLYAHNKESIYDKYFLTSSKVYFSYEAKFYASTYSLVSLFYKNYIFSKKLFFFYQFINIDFCLFFNISIARNAVRVRLTKPKVMHFRNTDIYNLFLLNKGRYGKKVKNAYRIKIRKSYTAKLRRSFSYSAFFSLIFTQRRLAPYSKQLSKQLSKKLGVPKIKLLVRRRRRYRFIRKIKRLYRFKKYSIIRLITKKLYRLRSRSAKATSVRRQPPRFTHLATVTASPTSFLENNILVWKTTLKRPSSLSFADVSILPSNSKSFILHYVGLLLLSKLNLRVRLGTHLLSTIRKKLYSFLKPNELKFRAFSARRRLTVIKLIRSLGKSTIVGRKSLSKSYLYTLFRGSFEGSKTCGTGHTFNNPLSRLPPLTRANMYHRENVFSFFSSAEGRVKTVSRDIAIERIKFKPGYQRLWRRFRLALAESLNYKYVYQQQLTKYLVKFSRKISQRSYYTHENTLRNIILYSRLIPDLAMLKVLLSNQIIFLNHKLVSSYLIYIYKNDFIQLEITIWFYLFSKWMLLWTRARNTKFKRLVYRKSLAGKYKIMKQRKQKSHYTPKWIFLVNFDFIDVKPFLEVDYLTLSFFIIYDFRFFYFYRPEVFTENKLNIYRMYNWKYIN